MQLSARTNGILNALFAILVWSGWMVFSSYGVRGSLTAYDITALRFATAGLCMAPIFLRRGMRIGPWGCWGALWLALLMGAAYNTIAITGMKYAATSHASIIQTSVLIFSTLGGIWLLKEQLRGLQALGIALSILGVIFLLESGDAINPSQNIGHALFLLSGMMWAGYTLSVRHWQADPVQVSACVCVLSAVLFLPIYFLFLPSTLSIENWQEAAFQAVYQGIINSIFALICYNRAVRCLGAGTTSAFLPLVPVLATLMAIPLLGEYPLYMEWAGLALAAVGVLLATGVVRRSMAPSEGL
jgi:drug/metabolite transporter (DMT)-like permease